MEELGGIEKVPLPEVVRWLPGEAVDFGTAEWVLVGGTFDEVGVEAALWILDSNLKHGWVCGASEGGPSAFRPGVFLKKPEVHLSGGVMVRRDLLEEGVESWAGVARALAVALGKGVLGAMSGLVLCESCEVDLNLEKGELMALAAAGRSEILAQQQPRHDAEVKVPRQLGPARLRPKSKKVEEKHVVFVVPHFAMGGSDKFTLDLAASLKRDQGYRVSFVSTLSKLDDWEEDFREVSEDLIPLQKFLTRPDFPRYIASHILAREADLVVVTHSAHGYECLPYWRKQCPGVVFVDYLHIVEQDWHDGGYPRYSLDYAAWLDKTLVSSSQLKRWLEERGRNPEEISVVTTNIDPEVWNPEMVDLAAEREKWGLEAGMPVILFAARLCDQKRPLFMLDIVSELEARGECPPFVCLVAGDGELREAMNEKVKSKGIKSMRFLGQLSPVELKPLMAISDIFLLPSENEGIALALFEAMAMGSVVVASDVGGQRDLVEKETGYLIELRDESAEESLEYVEVLVGLLGDTSRRKQVVESARTRIEERFTLRAMSDTFVKELPSEPVSVERQPVELSLDEAVERFRKEQAEYRKAQKGEEAILEEEMREKERQTSLFQELHSARSRDSLPRIGSDFPKKSGSLWKWFKK